jgi:uncharacterized delta-60 repeat protein
MRTRGLIRVVCALSGVTLLLGVATAFAAPARIDRGFGSGGIARTPLPPAYEVQPFEEIVATGDSGVVTRSGSYGDVEVRHYRADGTVIGTEKLKEAELQPTEVVTANGGRLVAVSSTGEGKDAVTRYAPGGARDDSFGSGGTSEALPFAVEAVAALPSGKVLAAGAGVYSVGGTKSPPIDQVFVARLSADGKLDPGFGRAGIVQLHSEDGVTGNPILHLQGRGEGAEVVVGSVEVESVVVALDGSGNLDSGFGEGGKVTAPGNVIGAGSGAGEALLVAGTKPPGSRRPLAEEEPVPEEFFVARYTAAGKLDPAFAGGSGIAVLDLGGEAHAGSALVESDGDILIGGFTASNPPGCPLGYFCEGGPVVVRFTPDGRPDPGFGDGGVVNLPALRAHFGTGYTDGVKALAPRPDGGVFAAGATQKTAFVAAIGARGSLDEGFGSGGIVDQTSTVTASSAPIATAVNGSGDIFVAARAWSGANDYGGDAVLRYSAEGRLDREFGERGTAFVPQGVRGLAVAPDGSSFVISGESSPESSMTKVSPTGAIDPGFGGGGSVIFPFRKYRFLPEAVTRLTNGDLVVAGNLGGNLTSRPAVLRYLPDGELDPSFGTGGVQVVKLGQGRYWLVDTMTVDRRGRILLAGSAPHRHEHGCCTRAAALIRLRANGHLDSSFGRGGGVLIGNGTLTVIDGLALRGNLVLAAATFTRFAGLEPAANGDRLFSIRPDGRLNRRFGDRGVAEAYLSPHRKSYDHGGEETVSVFTAPRRILLVRSGFYTPLISFSPNGRPQRNFPSRLKGLVPNRQKEDVPPGPLATRDGGSLLLGWSGLSPKHEGGGGRSEVNLQRLLLH